MSRIGRQPGAGGRRAIFNQQQEQEICNIAVANNSITPREIRTKTLEDNAGIFLTAPQRKQPNIIVKRKEIENLYMQNNTNV